MSRGPFARSRRFFLTGCLCGAICCEIASFPPLLYTCNRTDYQTEGSPDTMNLCAGALADTTWLTAIAPRDFVALAQRWSTLWPAYFPART